MTPTNGAEPVVAVATLGDEVLRTKAHDLVEIVRKNATIDWTVKESVRSKMKVMFKRILRKHGYPPDTQETVTQTVLKQAELLAEYGRKMLRN